MRALPAKHPFFLLTLPCSLQPTFIYSLSLPSEVKHFLNEAKRTHICIHIYFLCGALLSKDKQTSKLCCYFSTSFFFHLSLLAGKKFTTTYLTQDRSHFQATCELSHTMSTSRNYAKCWSNFPYRLFQQAPHTSGGFWSKSSSISNAQIWISTTSTISYCHTRGRRTLAVLKNSLVDTRLLGGQRAGKPSLWNENQHHHPLVPSSHIRLGAKWFPRFILPIVFTVHPAGLILGHAFLRCLPFYIVVDLLLFSLLLFLLV